MSTINLGNIFNNLSAKSNANGEAIRKQVCIRVSPTDPRLSKSQHTSLFITAVINSCRHMGNVHVECKVLCTE